MSLELLGTAAIGSAVGGLVSLIAPLAATALKFFIVKHKKDKISKVRITFKDASGESRTIEIGADGTEHNLNESDLKELIKTLEEAENVRQKVSS